MVTAYKDFKIVKLFRYCVVCGKKLTILLNSDKTYKGGHFFGKINLDKNKKAEYWECDECFYQN